MNPIDENIHIWNAEDRRAPPQVLEEEDAVPGGRWEDYLRSQHQQATQGATSSDLVRVSPRLIRELNRSWLSSSPQVHYGGPTPAGPPLAELPPVFDPFEDEEDNEMHVDEQGGMQTHQIQGQASADENGNSMQLDNDDTEDAGSQPRLDVADSDSSSSSEDSDDHKAIEAEEEERERISKLFEDFPTTIATESRVDPLDEEYGTTAMTQEPRWNYIAQAKLLPRVREWLIRFSSE